VSRKHTKAAWTGVDTERRKKNIADVSNLVELPDPASSIQVQSHKKQKRNPELS